MKKTDYDHTNNTTRLNQGIRKEIAFEVIKNLFAEELTEHNKAFKDFATKVLAEEFKSYKEFVKGVSEENMKWVIPERAATAFVKNHRILLEVKCDFDNRTFDIQSLGVQVISFSLPYPDFYKSRFCVEDLKIVANDEKLSKQALGFIDKKEELRDKIMSTFMELYPILTQCKTVKELVAAIPNVPELCNLPTPSISVGSSLIAKADGMNTLLNEYVKKKQKV